MQFSTITSRFLPYFKNAGLYFFASLFSAIVGVLLNPLMALNLDPVDYAIVGYYASFNLLFLPLSHCCLMTYYVRQYYLTPEDKRDNLDSTILIGVIQLGLVATLLFLAFFYLIYSNTEHDLPFWPYAVMTFVQIYIGNISTMYLSKLRITRQAKKYAIYSVLHCIVLQSMTILMVVFMQYGAFGKLSAALIITIIFSVYAFAKVYKPNKFDKQIFKSACKFGFPLSIAAIFWYLLSGVDKVFLEQLRDTNQLGIYNVGLSMAGYMTIFFTTINSTFEPDIYKSIADNNKKKLLMIAGVIIGFVTVANLLFALFAPFLIDILTAGRYVTAYPYARIMSLHNIIMALYTIMSSIIIGYGFVKQQLAIRVTGALFSVVLYKLLIVKYGFIGGAWGQVLSFMLLCIMSILFLLSQRNKLRKLS